MQTIKEGIKKFFDTNNKESHFLFTEIVSAWKPAVDKNIYKNTELVSVNNQILLIKTNSPIYRNEIALKKMEIIKKVNEKLKNHTINDLKII